MRTLDRCSGSGYTGVEDILGNPHSRILVNRKCVDGGEYKMPRIAVSAEFSLKEAALERDQRTAFL
jgi:hypothetical protein